MKKQNNILNYITKTAYAIALALSLYACTDEDVVESNYIEEGIPVEIGIKYTKPEMTGISTRGLRPEEEMKVNDLYILIFNENGSTKKGGGLFEGEALSQIKLQTTSGNSLIYGIANVVNNQQENLKLKLDAIQSISDLKECFIAARFEGAFIDVDRTSPNLVMSGAYSDTNNSSGTAGFCPITKEKDQVLSGTINLVHLDSHIKFQIHKGTKVKTFEPTEWQVCKVPKQSYLIAQDNTNSGGIDVACYANSRPYNNQNFLAEEIDKNGSKETVYTFQFYQFENFKPAIGGDFTAKMREEEVKNGKLNTGKFLHVDSCATYVQFKANLELQQEGVEQRIANVTIKILLGGKDKDGDNYDPRNFKTWRNKKYIYDVTINNVDDIVIEVTVGDENRPGLEGDVIDVINEAPVLDAHFNCFNILLDPEDFKSDDLSITVHTPFDDIVYDKYNTSRPSGNRDYKWVKFKFLSLDNYQFQSTLNIGLIPLASYKEDNNLLDIYGLKNDVKDRRGKSYYTVFIDEYYYTAPPRDNLVWKEPLWKNFVNQSDRYVILSSPTKSDDQESSYSKANYVIRQKSIQTYYSTATAQGTALGMEHVNETAIEDRVWRGSSTDLYNGYKNCDEYISSKGRGWSNHAFKHPFWDSPYCTRYPATSDKYTFTLTENESNSACLNRNRDKNGDGQIDDNEMDWYLPTFNQISGMYLGATSIPSPLFTYSPSMDEKVKSGNPKYHFMTSDNNKIWAEEGCSNNGSGSNPTAQQIRCVRNLGIEGADSKTNVPPRPYEAQLKNDHYVFDMSGIEASNLRDTKVTGTLDFHDNFSDTRNKPYKKFELAKEFMTKTKQPGNTYTWELYYDKEDPCKEYNEGEDERGKGKWRTPNQRELLIMYNTIGAEQMIYTDNDTKYGMYSCTYWKLNWWTDNESITGDGAVKRGYRIFGIHPTIKKMFLDNEPGDGRAGHTSEAGTVLRCVRDID